MASGSIKSLPKLPSIRDLIKIYGISAQSRFSQNFILDRNITDTIVKNAKIDFDHSLVIEVGPGPGLLTRAILNAGAKNLVAVEKDKRFIPTLEQLQAASENRFKAILGDILYVDHKQLMDIAQNNPANKQEIEKVHIIGNLPFNIATSLLIQWLYQMEKREGLFALPEPSMTLMFQKEVGLRISAPPSAKERGRLSVMTQSLCEAKTIYTVRSSSFVPKPKVDAAVIQFKLLKEPILKSSIKTLEKIHKNELKD
ncbi:hypothetical protein H4219_000273 [Mycoemilia scoparia]|uniref:rRNA adenine N(6)-methyltransferase n=1 Tax=Mycoemilia scoparia TaxID=417184 RepID=A0A9W8DWS9_9FUNG|nr:hypothetical protein H4219_000273 [Mycoemilia scoparia]